MCQLPLISMWGSRIRSPEKCMSSHLPRASTKPTVRPGSSGPKEVTGAPPSARARVRAVRKIVSPSGISGGLRLSGFGDVARLLDMEHLQAEGRWHEASLFEEIGRAHV